MVTEVITPLNISARSKTMWTLPPLWTHSTRPQGFGNLAKNARFPQRPHRPSVSLTKTKNEEHNHSDQLSTESDHPQLETDGVSANRRRYARVVLRMALNTAMRWRLMPQNPATLIDAPRVTAKEIRPFTPDEARTFVTAIGGHPLEAFFTVALACGLRLGEALGLHWDDIDLDGGTLRVRRALQRFGGDAKARKPLLGERKRLLKALGDAQEKGSDTQVVEALNAALKRARVALKAVRTQVQVVEPKSARSRRTIKMPDRVTKALKSHRVRQLEARLAAGQRWQDGAFVFTTATGSPLEPRNITRTFKAVLAAENLPIIRLHDLRHSCATLLLAQGVSPRVVMETLGHSQVSLTLNTYSHVLPTLQEDAASKMDAILAEKAR
jgi:integrase